jgi:hypothetical protein
VKNWSGGNIAHAIGRNFLPTALAGDVKSGHNVRILDRK